MKKIGISLFVISLVLLSACGGSSSSKIVCKVDGNGSKSTNTIIGDKKVESLEAVSESSIEAMGMDEDSVKAYIEYMETTIGLVDGFSVSGDVKDDTLKLTITLDFEDMDKEYATEFLQQIDVEGDNVTKVTPKEMAKKLEKNGYTCK